MYHDLWPQDDPLEAYQLLSGLANTTVEGNSRLNELSREALATPAVRAVFERYSPAEVEDELKKSGDGRAFWRKFEEYLATYGHRNDNTYLDRPTWLEDPTPAIQALKDHVARPDRDLDAELAAVARRRESRIAEVRRRLRGYPESAVTEFKRLLKAAQVATALSEEHNYWIDYRITYHLRAVCLEVGRRMVGLGLSDLAEDVFYLTLDELRSWVDGRRQEVFCSLIQERRAEADRYRHVRPPDHLGTVPSLPRLQDAVSRSIFRFAGGLPEPAAGANELRGVPGSEGKARGTARVVLRLSEAHELKPGEILVTTTTLPAWTVLFAKAAAIVTDTGGVLSHAAIVAREYGIPAVVGTRDGTRLIRSDQPIEVDGTTGIVRLLPP